MGFETFFRIQFEKLELEGLIKIPHPDFQSLLLFWISRASALSRNQNKAHQFITKTAKTSTLKL